MNQDEEQELKRTIIIQVMCCNVSDHLIERIYQLISDDMVKRVQQVVH